MKMRSKRSRIVKQLSSSSPRLQSSLSAEIVVANEDLLTQILLFLPIPSLLYFKSVSKRWLSIISCPRFSLLRNPLPLPASALFLPLSYSSRKRDYEFLPLDNGNSSNHPVAAPFKTLSFVNDPLGIAIIHSCNGLLLCSSYRGIASKRNYYVYNPTTKQYTILPQPNGNKVPRYVCGMSLAFDPSKSPSYKVVCVRRLYDKSSDDFQIEVYSSETGPPRVSGQPFSAHSKTNFENGVYWNGSVHWINNLGDPDFLYFNVDQERLQTMARPPSVATWYDTSDIYFGESNDHLHLIDVYSAVFNVYEMKRDYSEWFLKYTIDLEDSLNKQYGYSFEDYGVLAICSIVRRENDDGNFSFLVVEIPDNKVVSYGLVNKDLVELRQFPDRSLRRSHLNTKGGFQYIESLACV